MGEYVAKRHWGVSVDTHTILRWGIVVPVSVLLGWLFSMWRVPAAWILAAIIASGAMALITGEDLKVNRKFYGLSRGFIGIMAALPLTVVSFGQLVGYLPAAITMSFVTIALGIFCGVMLHRQRPRDVSSETGILSMLPGGASLMPALADELGADYRYVALTQYLRLLIVSVSLPAVVTFLDTPAGRGGDLRLEAETTWWIIALVLVIALVGERLGKFLHLPAAAVLGPLILTVLASFFLPEGHTLEPIYAFKVIAFLSIGWVCGGGLSLPSLKAFAKQLPATILSIAAVLGLCAATAWPLMHWLNISYFEAYLATSPGALETVLALSTEGGAGPVVIAVQLTRLIAVLVIAGYLPQLIRAVGKFAKRR